MAKYTNTQKLKKKDRKGLACLLQRMESFMVIEVICRRIAREKPKLPIFTIHDSIVTTKGNEGYVRNVMEEELEQFVGIKPHLKTKEWKSLSQNTSIVNSSKYITSVA